MYKKNILITGGKGFIGSHIVDALINRGDEVICIDDQSAPQNNMFFWNVIRLTCVCELSNEVQV